MTVPSSSYRRAERQRQQEASRVEVAWDGVCARCGGQALYRQRQSEPQARITCPGCDR